jgi:uncharacterized membrane protein YraQ (UPF0718 family)
VKIAALAMAALVVLLAALCAARGGMALVVQGLQAGGRGAMGLLPMLAIVFLLTGFVEVLLPRDTVGRWLSDEAGARGILIAWVAGALTPGGGPVGLPLAAALMRSGAGTAVLVTYVTSMSLLSFVRVPLELGTYGGRLTALRVLSCAALPPVAGICAALIARLLR